MPELAFATTNWQPSWTHGLVAMWDTRQSPPRLFSASDCMEPSGVPGGEPRLVVPWAPYVTGWRGVLSSLGTHFNRGVHPAGGGSTLALGARVHREVFPEHGQQHRPLDVHPFSAAVIRRLEGTTSQTRLLPSSWCRLGAEVAVCHPGAHVETLTFLDALYVDRAKVVAGQPLPLWVVELKTGKEIQAVNWSATSRQVGVPASVAAAPPFQWMRSDCNTVRAHAQVAASVALLDRTLEEGRAGAPSASFCVPVDGGAAGEQLRIRLAAAQPWGRVVGAMVVSVWGTTVVPEVSVCMVPACGGLVLREICALGLALVVRSPGLSTSVLAGAGLLRPPPYRAPPPPMGPTSGPFLVATRELACLPAKRATSAPPQDRAIVWLPAAAASVAAVAVQRARRARRAAQASLLASQQGKGSELYTKKQSRRLRLRLPGDRPGKRGV